MPSMNAMSETDEPSCCPSSSRDEPERRHHTGTVDLIDRGSLIEPSQAAWLTEHAQRLMHHLQLRGELRVELVDDPDMSTAHEKWLGDPTTTDVLTFDLRESADDPELDTDLLLCVDEARRQAQARSLPLEHELLLYITHGLLHCLGYDDHTQADSTTMHQREDELLAAIGLPAIYAPAEPPTEPADGTADGTAS